MPTPTDLTELARHMEWADALAWRSVLSFQEARGDERIRMWLYHIHMVQRAFLRVWRNEALRFRDPSEFPDLAALAAWGREGHREIQEFLAAADPASLERPVHLPWSAEVETMLGRPISEVTLAQTATQVVLHTMHHRGQVNARLRTLGGEPQYVDYIVWLWQGQPAADWPDFAG
ncbi:MAG TPA: DinB family protein [Thermoanaerobaculia bacterium]